MNKFCAVGRLTRDPELRYTETSHKACVRITIAIDRGISKEDKESGKQAADFVPLVIWDKQADFLSKYAKKGNRISVEGRMISGSYTKQDGSTGYTLEAHIDRLELLENKPKDERPEPEYTGYEKTNSNEQIQDAFADFGQEADLSDLDNNSVELDSNMLPF